MCNDNRKTRICLSTPTSPHLTTAHTDGSQQCWKATGCQAPCVLGNVQVNYINAHATSTLVGDIAEVRAVKSAFPDMSKMKINGTKSMIATA